MIAKFVFCVMLIMGIRMFANDLNFDLYNALWAISQVESGGNINAIGKNGELGMYQMKPIFVKDINRIIKKELFKLEDRKDRYMSRRMAEIYLIYYGRIYKEKTGKNPDIKVYAKMWKYGPYGWLKGDTNYSERVYNIYKDRIFNRSNL